MLLTVITKVTQSWMMKNNHPAHPVNPAMNRPLHHHNPRPMVITEVMDNLQGMHIKIIVFIFYVTCHNYEIISSKYVCFPSTLFDHLLMLINDEMLLFSRNYHLPYYNGVSYHSRSLAILQLCEPSFKITCHITMLWAIIQVKNFNHVFIILSMFFMVSLGCETYFQVEKFALILRYFTYDYIHVYIENMVFYVFLILPLYIILQYINEVKYVREIWQS